MGSYMENDTDLSGLIARVTASEQTKTAPPPKPIEPNNQFFPNCETAFTEVPVFKHHTANDP